MIDRPGSAVSYGAATPLERALHDVEGERLSAVPGHLVRDNWNPWKVQAGAPMAFLAWAMGVNLWEDTWSESTKREWMANNWRFQALRGTLAAFDMALAPSGYQVVDEVVPPGGFYASPDLTKEEMDAYVRQLPQLRVKFARKTGLAHYDEWFCTPDDDVFGFADYSTVPLDDGRLLYGRNAVVRYADGTEKPVAIVTETIRIGLRYATTFERFYLPNDAGDGFFADGDFADDGLATPDDAHQYTYTARVDRAYEHTSGELSLTPINFGMEPLTPRFEVDSDIGDAGPAFFADDGVPSIDYTMPDEADEMLADRVYLLDPKVAAPVNAGVSFADVDRVGVPRKTVELLIELHGKAEPDAVFADEATADVSFAWPQETGDIDRALRAVNAAKALRDTVLVDFETKKPLAPRDVFDANTKLGEWRPARL